MRTLFQSILLCALFSALATGGWSFARHFGGYSYYTDRHSYATLAITTILLALVALIAYRLGSAVFRLNFAPSYPRERYYGAARIKPECHHVEADVRTAAASFLVIVFVAMLLICVICYRQELYPELTTLAAGAAGILVTGLVAWPTFNRTNAINFDAEIEGAYYLYLRNFRAARWWLIWLVCRAAQSRKVVLIISPARREAWMIGWYIIAMFFPRAFSRVWFWSTSDEQWTRVAASCMSHSEAIVLDAINFENSVRGGAGSGITFEMYVSGAFAAKNPTAYVVHINQNLPEWFPLPAIVGVSFDPAWLLLNAKHVSQRVKSIAQKELSPEENAYLETFYKSKMDEFASAMIADRNLAFREGRGDPNQLLLAEDPQRAMKEYSKAAKFEDEQ